MERPALDWPTERTIGALENIAADSIRGLGGNDILNGRGGNDTVQGEDGEDEVLGNVGNDFLKGGAGGDLIVEGNGADEAYGMTGNDDIRMSGDTHQDFVNCGEDPGGTDVDTARVSGNDLINGTLAGGLTTTTGLSCERVIVDGVAIPQL
jgi:Ca2+-binding RTX toxin-like protein